MDIFNPITGEILKIPSPDLSPYWKSDGSSTATGDWDLGTHNLALKEINQYATSEYDGPVFSSELLDDTGWTTSGVTGSWSTFFLPSSYTGWSISRPVSITIGKKYLVEIIVQSATGDDVNVSLGGSTPVNISVWNLSTLLVITAISTANFTVTPGFLKQNITFSIKEITTEKKSIFNIYDSTNTKTFEIQSTSHTLNNAFFGLSSGSNNVNGYENIGFGNLSLWQNIGGYQNTTFGYKTLYSNTSGYQNVALGSYSLYTNNGNNNVGIGVYSLYTNNSAGNVSIGAYSMYNSIGGSNVSIGKNALYSAVGGYGGSNVAIGDSSLLANNSGGYNVAIGSSSLKANSSGANNVGLGYFCLSANTIGANNIGFGNECLGKNTTGTNNIGLGYRAGSVYGAFSDNINSTYSIFIGRETKASAANGVNEIVIGYNATGNGSNTVTLGHTDITKTYLRGDIYPVDGKNIVLGTTTGMKIGTATNQKIGFFNATPIVQVGATIDLGTVLSNLGLRAAGTAYTITTSGAVSFTGNFTHNTGTATFSNGFTIADAKNIVLNTTTGTKIGTANTQKIGFWNATPVVQPGAYTQTYSTATRTHANLTSADIGAFTGGIVGFLDAAERDNIRTQYNALKADLTNIKQLVNAMIDDHQSIGLAS